MERIERMELWESEEKNRDKRMERMGLWESEERNGDKRMERMERMAFFPT